MTETFHFTCTNCFYTYVGPLGHVYGRKDQVVSVVCTTCTTIEARRINWIQVVPDAHKFSNATEKLQLQADTQERDKPLHSSGKSETGMEWCDYSLQVADIFKCWSCENELYLWDKPICPCCGGMMNKDFSVRTED